MDGIYNYPFLTQDWHSLNLNLFENGMFHGGTFWNLPNMSSPFNRIYFMMDGEAYLENENEHIPLIPGKMYLIPAESRYSYVCPSTMQKFFVHFSMELLPGADLFSHFTSVLELPYDPALLETILLEVKKESISGLLHLKAIFWEIVYTFFLHGTQGIDYLDSFKGFYKQRKVLDYLASHIHAGLRVQELADALQVPVHQLSRSFHQDTKQGLKEYIGQLLLQRARHLLLHTDMSIGEIAEALGFSDPYYFSRLFKKYEGIAPREYRKQQF